METFDLVILALAGIALAAGFITGFVMQVALLAGVVLGTVFSGQIAVLIAPKLAEWTNGGMHIIFPLSYILAFVLIVILLALAGRLLQSLLKIVKINIVNRIAGALLGLITCLFLVGIAVNVMEKSGRDGSLITDEVREKSFTYPIIKEVAAAVTSYLHFNRR